MKLLNFILHFCYTMRLIGMALVFTALMRVCDSLSVDTSATLCGTLLWLVGQITVNMTKYIKDYISRNCQEKREG